MVGVEMHYLFLFDNVEIRYIIFRFDYYLKIEINIKTNKKWKQIRVLGPTPKKKYIYLEV